MEIALPGARRFNEFLGRCFTNLDILPPNYFFGNTMNGVAYSIEVVSGNEVGRGVYLISGIRGKLAQRQRKFIGILPGYRPIDKPFLKKSDNVVFNTLARLEYTRFKDLIGDEPYPVYLAVAEYFNEPPPLISEEDWTSYLESHKGEVSNEIRKRVKLELLANSGSESDVVREKFADGGKLPEAIFGNLWTPETEALAVLLIKSQNQKAAKSVLDHYKKYHQSTTNEVGVIFEEEVDADNYREQVLEPFKREFFHNLLLARLEEDASPYQQVVISSREDIPFP